MEVHPSCEANGHSFLELMPKDPHDQAALTWTYQLFVHLPRPGVEVAEVVVLHPEVEVVAAEVAAEVLHHPEVAGAVEAVEAVGVQGQNHSLGEGVAVQMEALFFRVEVEAVQVRLDGRRGAEVAVAVAARMERLR